MSEGLDAIANELRRLQRDGVDRVFIEDHTMEMLSASKASESNRSKTTSKEEEAIVSNSVKAVEPPPQTVSPSAMASPTIPEPPAAIELPSVDAKSQLSWLRGKVLACPVCNENLSENGSIVFGAGNPAADIFFCGEAPGADEEHEGEPFVGKAGQLLTKIITAMGLQREKVYIANILKWRPEHDKPYGNRPPTLEEMRYCLPYLEAQIKIVQPKVIVALGNTAVTGLLGPDPNRKMGAVRGSWASFKDIPTMITFHPSYLLRNGTLKTKRMVWEDMLKVMEYCELPINEMQRGFFLPKG